jgi:transposase, IS30 family
MEAYNRLTLFEREKIYEGYVLGDPQTLIALALNRHPSTISRELRRLGYGSDYSAVKAHSLAETASSKRRNINLFRSAARRNHIDKHLRKGWSPEQISGRLKLKISPLYLCLEAIYAWIYSEDGKKNGWQSLLLSRRKKRRRRCYQLPRKKNITKMVNICERPETINNRSEYGHFEGDLLEFNREVTRNVGVMIERKSRFSLLTLNQNKTSKEVIGNMMATITGVGRKHFRSITFDQGVETVNHLLLRRAPYNMQTFHCDAHSPWQKGAVENLNKILRRHIVKGERNDDLTIEKLEIIQNKINNTPRKIINFRTAKEAFEAEIRQNFLQKNKTQSLA